jgi:hypothetical protein
LCAKTLVIIRGTHEEIKPEAVYDTSSSDGFYLCYTLAILVPKIVKLRKFAKNGGLEK